MGDLTHMGASKINLKREQSNLENGSGKTKRDRDSPKLISRFGEVLD